MCLKNVKRGGPSLESPSATLLVALQQYPEDQCRIHFGKDWIFFHIGINPIKTTHLLGTPYGLVVHLLQ